MGHTAFSLGEKGWAVVTWALQGGGMGSSLDSLVPLLAPFLQGSVQNCQTLGPAKRTSRAGITTHSVNTVPASPMVVAMATRTALKRSSSVLSTVVASAVSGGAVAG